MKIDYSIYKNQSIDDQRLENWNQGDFERHINCYSNFLLDNDFETYQPLVYNHTKQQEIEAQRQLVRALWIKRRIPLVGTVQDSFYEGLFNVEHQKLMAMIE